MPYMQCDKKQKPKHSPNWANEPQFRRNARACALSGKPRILTLERSPRTATNGSVNILRMNMPRFYCEPSLLSATRLELPEHVAHHIRVRRIKIGAGIVLFDGLGNEVQATLRLLDRKRCEVDLGQPAKVNRERAGQIVLVQGLASQDRMDWIVEKAVEIGVHTLIPVQSARSVAKLSAERSIKRLEHWRRIVQAASEQCARNVLMQIQPVANLQQAIAQVQHHTMLVCDTADNAERLRPGAWLEKIAADQKFSLFVGPEGGWDNSEHQELKAASAVFISLGARVLRTETAGLTAVASLSTLLQW
jgi:16S rRNA (uracil1498-N3)-methyltransferase